MLSVADPRLTGVAAADPRLIGVAVADVSDWRETEPRGKWSRLFGSLSRTFGLDEVIAAEASRPSRWLNLGRQFRPSKGRWRASAGFSASLANARTQRAQEGLDRHRGSYDLIFQLQTMCAPGVERHGIPYVIYTDNTMAITQRHYAQGVPLSSSVARRWMRFEAEVCRAAEAVFTCSEFTRASMVHDYGCRPERVVAAGAGANQVLESIEDKNSSEPRALFVGMDFARKGGNALLAAWPQVRKRVPDAELLVVGPKAAPASALPAGVHWLGNVDRRTLAGLYASAALFVMPSLFEPWGFVFYEAMGHGLPCIGSSICAMPEMIRDGVTGALVPPGDPDALANALARMLGDLPATATMGRAAHREVLGSHRWSDVTERIAAELRRRTTAR